MTDPQSGHSFTYDGLKLVRESRNGPGLTYVLTPTYQTSTNEANALLNGRPASLGVGPDVANPTTWYNTTYSYDTSGRMNQITGPGLPAGGAVYYRATASDLIGGTQFKDQNGSVLGQAIKSYETQRDLIKSVENKWGSTRVSKYAYENDNLARRENVVRTGSAFGIGIGGLGDHQELYSYNPRNELTGANTYGGADLQNPGTEISARSRSYLYDQIGNRGITTAVTNAPTSWAANNLNQYQQICTPEAGHFCEYPTYDHDGNLTGDASFTYTWDFENRLHQVIPKTVGTGAKYVEFDYDYLHRRVRKRGYAWASGQWSQTPSEDIRYVYDGWNILMELDGLNSNAVIRKYTWGLDLSGTKQSAGGIGGLHSVFDAATSKSYLYQYDANGNVGQLVDLADGSLDARYEYDPYGSTVVAEGPYAAENPFRFSTKYYFLEIGLYDYGRRFYTSRWGRWASRDPIEERSDSHLYRALSNAPIEHIDFLGLACAGICGPDVTYAVRALLREVDTAYAALPAAKQDDLCDGYMNAASWDTDLYTRPTRFLRTAGCSWLGCRRDGRPPGQTGGYTVTFNGRCVWSYDLNYVLYGRIARNCRNEDRARFWLEAYKWWAGHSNERTIGALHLFWTGAHHDFDPDGWFFDARNCAPCGKLWHGRIGWYAYGENGVKIP